MNKVGAPPGNKNHLKHGGTGTRLYNIWKTMRQRCLNPRNSKYKRYGGRGITFDIEWDDFSRFSEWALNNGYRDDLTIDRVDNDGNYCPKNCRWVSVLDQQNNRSDNIAISFNGMTYNSISQFCRNKNIKYKLFHSYLRKGMSIDEAYERARV